MELFSLILFSLFNMLLALEKPCRNCKFYIPTIGNNDLGLCKIFKEKPYLYKNIAIHNFAIHCRNNENLCGKDGIFFEPNINYINDYHVNSVSNSVSNNDDEEVEQIKKELYEVFQKIKKYNKKEFIKYSETRNN